MSHSSHITHLASLSPVTNDSPQTHAHRPRRAPEPWAQLGDHPPPSWWRLSADTSPEHSTNTHRGTSSLLCKAHGLFLNQKLFSKFSGRRFRRKRKSEYILKKMCREGPAPVGWAAPDVPKREGTLATWLPRLPVVGEGGRENPNCLSVSFPPRN